MPFYWLMHLFLLVYSFYCDYANVRAVLLYQIITSAIYCQQLENSVITELATAEVASSLQIVDGISNSSNLASTNQSVVSTTTATKATPTPTPTRTNQTSSSGQESSDQATELSLCHGLKLTPPVIIAISNIKSNSFDVSWSSPSLLQKLSCLSSISAYEILLNSPLKASKLIKISSFSNSHDELKYTIENLTVCSFYIIQMRTISTVLMKSSDWSIPISITTSIPKVISESHFEVENISPTTQKVKWSKFTLPDNCMAFIHLLQTNQRLHSKMTISLSLNETEYIFHNLDQSTQYTYQLKVISPFGYYLRHYVSISTTTLPEAHLRNITIYPPRHINILNITSTSFIVSWSPPLNDTNQSYVTGYEILLTSGSLKPSKSTSGSSSVITAVKGVSNDEQFQEKIENLISCKLYTIQMRSVIDSALTVYSEWSQPVSTFTSVTDVIQTFPIQIINIERNVQKVIWSQLSETLHIHNECEVYLELIQYNHATHRQMAVKLQLNETTFTYDDLEPLTTYAYSINLISPFGQVENICAPGFAETLPEGPNAPTNLSIPQILPNQITLKWINPPQHPAFNISCYRIYKRESVNVMNSLFDEYRVCDVTNEYQVTSLLPGRQYIFYVMTEDSVYGLLSNASEMVNAYTYPSEPDPPVNVTISQIRSTEFIIQWTEVAQNSAFIVHCYVIHIYSTDVNISNQFQKFNICNTNEFHMKSLYPGVNYTIYIQSVDSVYDILSIQSEYATAITYPNKPNPPEDVTVISVNPNKFTLNWSAPKQDPAFTNTCYLIFNRPLLNINQPFKQFNVCSGENQFTVDSLLPGINYTVYMKSFASVYNVYSDATELLMVYTHPEYLLPPVNITITNINIFGFTVNWNRPVQNSAFGNEYYYVYIAPLHSESTQEPIRYEAGTSANQLVIDNLTSDTWYNVFIQCVDSIYHISSRKSVEILVHTYPETAERDNINQLTNLILHTSSTQTNQIQQDSMIKLYLPLSLLNDFIPTVYMVTLVLKPSKESDYNDVDAYCSEGCTTRIQYNDTNEIALVEPTYNNRNMNENASWEILVQSQPMLKKQTRFRRSVDNSKPENYSYSNEYFIIGANNLCVENSHKCNGPLKPATQYSIQLRTYTKYGYTTSKVIHGHTLSNTTVIVVTCCLLWSLFVLAVSTFGFLHYRIFEGKNSLFNSSTSSSIKQNEENNDPKEEDAKIMKGVKLSEKIIDSDHTANIYSSVNWPSVVNTSEFNSRYEKYLEDSCSALKEEYQLIVNISQSMILSDMLTQEIGRKNVNKKLNRFMDILPYDQTRVKLNPFDKCKQDHDYVNASFIYEIIPCSNATTHPVLNRNKIDYIASQAPLESTVGDFWRMIIEQNVTIIVMLTRLYEDDISKCYQYWPNDIHESIIFLSDSLSIEVTLLSEENHEAYILRKFYVTSSKNQENGKYVVQMHMISWPDFGVPKLNEFQILIKDYREMKCEELHKFTPTLVHCTAGVGRTGTFIVADLLQKYKESNCIYYDIPGIILQMRRCRTLMVQKVAQYIFLHHFAHSLFQ
ncbi:unnamed protein product [Trichobilharzia szidati]|nr:unnamed protein product [Trichobilharzia szidati]